MILGYLLITGVVHSLIPYQSHESEEQEPFALRSFCPIQVANRVYLFVAALGCQHPTSCPSGSWEPFKPQTNQSFSFVACRGLCLVDQCHRCSPHPGSPVRTREEWFAPGAARILHLGLLSTSGRAEHGTGHGREEVEAVGEVGREKER